MDKLSPEQRSRCMASVKGKDTKPEILVRKFLFSKGLRFRLHSKKLKGHPDLVFAKYKTVVFIDGCFWHGHEGCGAHRIPKTNSEFWEKKIRHNKARDIANTYILDIEGWKVIRIWECEIIKIRGREERLYELYREITGKSINNAYSAPVEADKIAAESWPEYSK